MSRHITQVVHFHSGPDSISLKISGESEATASQTGAIFHQDSGTYRGAVPLKPLSWSPVASFGMVVTDGNVALPANGARARVN